MTVTFGTAIGIAPAKCEQSGYCIGLSNAHIVQRDRDTFVTRMYPGGKTQQSFGETTQAGV